MKPSIFNLLPVLSSFSISIYAFFLRFLRRIGWVRVLPSSALILPPAAPGSVGDEALVVATVEYLKSQNVKSIGLVSHNINMEYPVSVLESFDMRDYFIYSSAIKFLKKAFAFGFFVIKYENFYLLGADLMDGHYSDYATFKRVKLVEIAEKSGLKSTILGFSFNDNPTPVAVKIFKQLPDRVKLCARDALSRERLEKKIGRAVTLVADVAFLLPPDEESPRVSDVSEWIESQKRDDRIVVGINCNQQLIEKLPQETTETLVESYVNCLRSLSDKFERISFLLLPHDFRTLKDIPSDDKLSRLILERLPSEIEAHARKIPAPSSAREIKAIVGKIDFVLTGRMHLAVAALGRGTPIFCVTRQGKFEGLCKHFELENVTITPREFVDKNSDNLTKALGQAIENRDALHQKIGHQLPKVKELAELNLRD